MGYFFTFFFLFGLVQAGLAFVHPGLLVTAEDITRAQRHIAAGDDPWTSSWERLESIPYSSPDYASQAVSELDRDTNGLLLWQDTAAAFNLALRWKISGNDTYADASGRILTSWADTLTVLDGNDDLYLSAGLQGYELANAAELLRDYEPFAVQNLSKVVTMLTDIFLPANQYFLNHEDPSEHNVIHFFANWELCQVASVMAIGILADNTTAWEFGLDYLKNGAGNGNINNAISYIIEEPGTGNPLGQGQEEGRDQGHSALDYQLLAAVAQQAWNQGVDVYGFNESRILLGAEYFARYNLGYDVPFLNYTNSIVYYNQISNSSRGSVRPTWELLYSHYVQIKGVEAPWTTEYLNFTLEYFGGFEGGAGSWGEGSGHYDGLGWGSLLYHMDGDDLASYLGASSTTTAVSAAVTHAFISSETSVSSSASAATSPVQVSTVSITSYFSSSSGTTASAISVATSVTGSVANVVTAVPAVLSTTSIGACIIRTSTRTVYV